MNKINQLLQSILMAVGIFFGFSVFGQSDIPEQPNPPKLVNNFSKEFPDFLSAGEENQLEDKLEKFAAATSNQIVIVIVDELNGYDAAEYAYRIGDKWGVGQAKEKNGIVILVKPTQSGEGRKVAIEIGKGLEGAIPDVTAFEVQERELIPNLKAGNNFVALDKTTQVLMKLAKGEFNSDAYAKRSSDDNIGTVIFVIIVIILFVLFIFRNNNNGRGGGFTMGPGGMFFGGFGGGYSGGSGGSSGGFGGFGGFGGGSFGGGGSSGSW